VAKREPVRGKGAGKRRFAGATFRGGKGDHTKHRIAFMN
jgi:hypothetical protein